MFFFNPYAIPLILVSMFTLTAGIIVLKENFRAHLNRSMFYWCFCISAWTISYAIVFCSSDKNIANIMSRAACTAVVFLFFTGADCLLGFLNPKKFEKCIFSGYLIGMIFSILIFSTDLLLSGTHHYFFGFYGKAGPYYLPTILFLQLFFIYAAFSLFSAIKNKQLQGHKLIQGKYILLGFCIALLGCIDFIPKFGIEIYPFGYIFMIFWALIMSYTILKHQLLNFQIVIKKSLVYSILFAIISIAFITIILLSEKIFQIFVGYKSTLISTFAAIFIAILFLPLKNLIQSFLDKYFFKGSPMEIARQNELLRQKITQTDKLKAISTLTSGVAHEIKNPVTAIKTFAEYLPQKWDDPDFRLKFSRIVNREVDRIDDLVHQLLDFAKPAPLALKETDLQKFINDTLDFLNSKFIKHHIKVVKNLDAESRQLIKLDPNQFRQALLNILLNAIDVMEDGGILTVRTLYNAQSTTSNAKRTAYDAQGAKYDEHSTQYVSITISDTGPGISENDLKHIFDPFFSKKDKGTGLGLSITQEIIKNHGGNIFVESTIGQGTSFVMKLLYS